MFLKDDFDKITELQKNLGFRFLFVCSFVRLLLNFVTFSDCKQITFISAKRLENI